LSIFRCRRNNTGNEKDNDEKESEISNDETSSASSDASKTDN